MSTVTRSKLLKLIIVALTTFRCAFATQSPKYFRLMSEVQEHFVTSSVFLLHDDFRGLKEWNELREFIRLFSTRGVRAISMNFGSLNDSMKFHGEQPLFVVVFDSAKSVVAFSKYTKNVKMNYPVWLLIFDKHVEPRSFTRKRNENIFHLTFDTRMVVFWTESRNVEEWYSLHNQTRTAVLATWDSSTGLVLRSNLSLYQRRRNLENSTIVVAINDNSVMTEDQQPTVAALYSKVILEIGSFLNFNIVTVSLEEKFAANNYSDEPGPNDVIEMLEAGEADIATSDMVMTASRMNSIDFLHPMIISRTKLSIRRPEGGIHWSGYFKIFTPKVWYAIGSSIFFTTVLLTLTVRIHCERISYDSISNQFLLVLGVYCQQGLSESPTTWSLKIVCLFTLASALVVSAAYSATLTSHLAVANSILPFTSLETYLADGSYELILFTDSVEYELLSNTTDETLIKMASMLRPIMELPTTTEEAFRQHRSLSQLQQICEERVAFLHQENSIEDNALGASCNMISIGQNQKTNLAMAASKSNQFYGIINYYIRRFLYVGIVDRFTRQRRPIMDAPVVIFYQVNLAVVTPTLIFLASGIAVAAVVLAVEIFLAANSQTYQLQRPVENRPPLWK